MVLFVYCRADGRRDWVHDGLPVDGGALPDEPALPGRRNLLHAEQNLRCFCGFLIKKILVRNYLIIAFLSPSRHGFEFRASPGNCVAAPADVGAGRARPLGGGALLPPAGDERQRSASDDEGGQGDRDGGRSIRQQGHGKRGEISGLVAQD